MLVVVAYHMSEWRAVRGLLRAPRSDVAVLGATFLLTVLVDLTVAIEVGMVLAALLFMRRMAEVADVRPIVESMEDAPDEEAVEELRRLPEGVLVYEVSGPFFFGAAEAFKETLGHVSDRPPLLVLRMRHVSVIDATGLAALMDVVHRFRRDGTIVVLSGVQPGIARVLRSSGVMREVGRENVCRTFERALERCRQVLLEAGVN